MTEANQRRWEIDAIRGLAVFGMVLYHVVYDLSAFGGLAIDPLSPGWKLFAHLVLGTFLIVSGLSDALVTARRPNRAIRWRKALHRAGRLGLAALLVTIVTALAIPEMYIRFGVLHCLAVAALVLPLFDSWTAPVRLLAAAALITAPWLLPVHSGWAILLPLGITPNNFATADYVPLLPWLGLVLIGQVFAVWWLKTRILPQPRATHPLAWIGRYALPIYLLHQPVLVFVIRVLLTSGK